MSRAMRPRGRMIFIAAMMAVGSLGARAEERRLTVDDDLSESFAAAKPGDVFVMADGDWKDVAVHLEAEGTEEQPITLRAETPSKVVITGKSRLRLAGRHLVVEGLLFQDVAGESEVIATRIAGSRLAHHCRVTGCAVVNRLAPAEQIESKWLSLYGTENRVDHCSFAGKNNRGPTLVVWVQESPNGHRIDHNYFGRRDKIEQNGAETIRVGTSDVSLSDSRTIVEMNLFEECDGEAEIISSKSCENTFRANTFLRCAGALTLRHGNRCTVEGNFFLGEGKRETGGVRVVGEDHRIVNNYFERLMGDERRSAISFMNGIPRAALNSYAEVRGAEVAFNTIVDCKTPLAFGIDAGTKQSLAPRDCTIANNVFIGAGRLIHEYAPPVDCTWSGNLRQTADTAAGKLPGVRLAEVRFAKDLEGIWRPSADSPAIGAAVGEFPHVTADIDGHPRRGAKDAGCDQLTDAPPRGPLKRGDVGPSWRR